MRARAPDLEGSVERDAVKTHYEVFGDRAPTLLFLPAWSIAHSRIWKMQVAYLARHYRVITFDGRGNGQSDRPVGGESYTAAHYAADALAVLDATETERAVVVSLSRGAMYALQLNALCAGRMVAQVFICPTTPLATGNPARAVYQAQFEHPLDTDEGWAKDNAAYWHRDFRGFVEFFFSQVFGEPHSTRPIEEATGWGLETTAETLIDTRRGSLTDRGVDLSALLQQVRSPCLVVQGTEDAVVGGSAGARLAEALGSRARLVELVGSGHCPQVRDPVKVNLLIREFVDAIDPKGPVRHRRWTRSRSRTKRVLYLSSPIGLGHARRDLAIAQALRRQDPDLQIDWLAQHPVTALLTASGEKIHPAAAALANESAHIEAESGDHDLHAFQAWRRMDEILLANFMVFRDLIADEPYDLWIGD
jgi:pimeloyl-ACP methyl ester carboxylesterase